MRLHGGPSIDRNSAKKLVSARCDIFTASTLKRELQLLEFTLQRAFHPGTG